MKVFIPHLPEDLKRHELQNVIHRAAKPSWLSLFNGSARVSRCKLVRILDLETGGIEYHGMVEIQPDSVARKAIRRLNKTQHNGYRLAARKWVDRTLLVGGRKRLPSGQNACKRRKNLEITVA